MSSPQEVKAAAVAPPEDGHVIVLASVTSVKLAGIPAEMRSRFVDIHAEGADCYFVFSDGVSVTVSETATTTYTSGDVVSYTTDGCGRIPAGETRSYDLSLVTMGPDAVALYFVHKESATGGYVRITPSSGTTKGGR